MRYQRLDQMTFKLIIIKLINTTGLQLDYNYYVVVIIIIIVI